MNNARVLMLSDQTFIRSDIPEEMLPKFYAMYELSCKEAADKIYAARKLWKKSLPRRESEIQKAEKPYNTLLKAQEDRVMQWVGKVTKVTVDKKADRFGTGGLLKLSDVPIQRAMVEWTQSKREVERARKAIKNIIDQGQSTEAELKTAYENMIERVQNLSSTEEEINNAFTKGGECAARYKTYMTNLENAQAVLDVANHDVGLKEKNIFNEVDIFLGTVVNQENSENDPAVKKAISKARDFLKENVKQKSKVFSKGELIVQEQNSIKQMSLWDVGLRKDALRLWAEASIASVYASDVIHGLVKDNTDVLKDAMSDFCGQRNENTVAVLSYGKQAPVQTKTYVNTDFDKENQKYREEMELLFSDNSDDTREKRVQPLWLSRLANHKKITVKFDRKNLAKLVFMRAFSDFAAKNPVRAFVSGQLAPKANEKVMEDLIHNAYEKAKKNSPRGLNFQDYHKALKQGNVGIIAVSRELSQYKEALNQAHEGIRLHACDADNVTQDELNRYFSEWSQSNASTLSMYDQNHIHDMNGLNYINYFPEWGAPKITEEKTNPGPIPWTTSLSEQEKSNIIAKLKLCNATYIVEDDRVGLIRPGRLARNQLTYFNWQDEFKKIEKIGDKKFFKSDPLSAEEAKTLSYQLDCLNAKFNLTYHPSSGQYEIILKDPGDLKLLDRVQVNVFNYQSMFIDEEKNGVLSTTPMTFAEANALKRALKAYMGIRKSKGFIEILTGKNSQRFQVKLLKAGVERCETCVAANTQRDAQRQFKNSILRNLALHGFHQNKILGLATPITDIVKKINRATVEPIPDATLKNLLQSLNMRVSEKQMHAIQQENRSMQLSAIRESIQALIENCKETGLSDPQLKNRLIFTKDRLKKIGGISCDQLNGWINHPENISTTLIKNLNTIISDLDNAEKEAIEHRNTFLQFKGTVDEKRIDAINANVKSTSAPATPKILSQEKDIRVAESAQGVMTPIGAVKEEPIYTQISSTHKEQKAAKKADRYEALIPYIKDWSNHFDYPNRDDGPVRLSLATLVLVLEHIRNELNQLLPNVFPKSEEKQWLDDIIKWATQQEDYGLDPINYEEAHCNLIKAALDDCYKIAFKNQQQLRQPIASAKQSKNTQINFQNTAEQKAPPTETIKQRGELLKDLLFRGNKSNTLLFKRSESQQNEGNQDNRSQQQSPHHKKPV